MAEEEWITINGAKFKVDEDGVIVAGSNNLVGKILGKTHNGGHYKAFVKPSKDFTTFCKESGKSHREAAREYFDQYFKDRIMSCNAFGENELIKFTGKTWKKFRYGLDFEPDKMLVLEHLPKLTTKKGVDPKNPNEASSNGFKNYKFIKTKITLSNGRTARVHFGIGKKDNNYIPEAHSLSLNPFNKDTKKVLNLQSCVPNHRQLQSSTVRDSIDNFLEIVNLNIEFIDDKAKDMKIVLDKNTKRHIDANGFMHVSVSNISKEIVNPYYGYEIPTYRELGLDPDKVYNVYRTGKALEEGAKSFNNLPLMRDHYIDSAESPQREHRVGSIGSDCVFVEPYLQASLCVTDGEAIRKIESGERVEACSKQAKLLSEIEKDLVDKQLQDFSKIQAQIQTLQNQQISSNQSLQNLVEHYNTLATMFKNLHEELKRS